MAKSYDGEIVLSTRIDTSKVGKQLKALEKRLENQQIDLDLRGEKLQSEQARRRDIGKELDSINKRRDATRKEARELKALYEEIKAKNPTQGEDLYTLERRKRDYEANRAQQIALNQELKNANILYSQSNSKVKSLTAQYEKQKNNVQETKQRIEEAKQAVEQYQAKMKQDYWDREKKKVGGFLEKMSKKLSHLSLTLIGVRSLYGMITSSISRISNANPQLKAQIDAMRNAIDNIVFRVIQALLPAIQLIVAIIGKLLKSLFGIDIYSQDFSKNLQSGSKSAGAIRKQLMGFDEMNILNKDGSTGGLGGTNVNLNVPQVNLEGVKTKIQSWFDKHHININLDYVEDALKNPGEYLKGWFVDKLLPNILKGSGLVGGMIDTIFPKNSALKTGYKEAVGVITSTLPGIGPLNILGKIGSGIYSVGKTIWDFIFGSDDDAKNAQGRFIDGLSLMGKTNENFAKRLVDAYKNSTVEIVEGLNGNMYMIKTSTGESILYTEDQFKDLVEFISLTDQNLADKLKKNNKNITKDTKKNTNETKNNIFETMNGVINKAPQIAKAINDGNYKIKKDYVEIKLATGETVKYSIDEFKKLQRKLTDVGEEGVNSSEKNKKSWVDSYKEINTRADELKQAILDGNVEIENGIVHLTTKSGTSFAFTEDAFKKLKEDMIQTGDEGKNSGDKTKKSWVESANEIIKKFTGNDKESVTGAVKDSFNELPQSAETNTKNVFKKITDLVKNYNPPKKKISVEADTQKFKDQLISMLQKLPSTGLFGQVNSAIISKIRNAAKGAIIGQPRLAMGGIINRPGRGIPLAVGGAIAGERGREAVLPLTDSQQMAYLGREIAKNVVIQLTNVTELDGRVLARTTARVMNEMNFASNGGAL